MARFRHRLLQFAVDVGIRERAAERALDSLLARTEPVLADVASLHLPYGLKSTPDWQRQLNFRRHLLAA